MQKHPVTFGQMIIWGFLAIGLIMLNGGSVIGDNPPASRWARVDLTQYCGKTVGELIDALGDDYLKYEPISSKKHFLDYFRFEYSDAIMRVRPGKLKYCDADLSKGNPKMEDVSREQIFSIELLVGY